MDISSHFNGKLNRSVVLSEMAFGLVADDLRWKDSRLKLVYCNSYGMPQGIHAR